VAGLSHPARVAVQPMRFDTTAMKKGEMHPADVKLLMLAKKSAVRRETAIRITLSSLQGASQCEDGAG
jgi:hypothetical protein